MVISNRKIWTIWGLWALVFPLGLWLTFHYFPPQFIGKEWQLLAFLVLMCILSMLPIMINKDPVTVVQGVSLALFLEFGLAAEIMATQISFIFILLMVHIRRTEVYRIPLNSLIFFIISLTSGLAYYSFGGDHQFGSTLDGKHIVLIIVYQLVYFVTNSIMLSISDYFLHNKKFTFKDEGLLWDGIATLLILPIGIILFILYQQIGVISIVLIGVPIISLAWILKLYNQSKQINTHLKSAGEFGHQLTQKLHIDGVLDLFINRISTIVETEQGYIFDIYNVEKEIHLLRYFENGVAKEKNIEPLRNGLGITGEVWQTGKALLFHSRKEWKDLDMGIIDPEIESIMTIPIVRDKLVVAEVMLVSTKKRAYENHQMMIMDILCSYLGVAIENARHHSLAMQQSERCPLTNLYNYRYIERELQVQFTNLANNIIKNVSLILIDIDRFKAINDNYGHQSGNEILCQLAERLNSIVGKTGTLARYGGEEFVIVLPNLAKEEAFKFAEFIRLSIANKPFSVHSDLDEQRSKQLVTITASMGVATAPTDADDEQALIRHADRAMYTGAKQAGRNKVAQYVG